MKRNRADLVSLALIVLSFAMSAVLYGRLPDPVPTHWDANGHVNGFTPKPWGAFIGPILMLGVFALLKVLPRISPQGFRMGSFQNAYEIIRPALVAFLFLVMGLALLAGAGVPVPLNGAIFAGVGLLFIVLGNYMGKLTKNFFVGIRTPWTLASEEVWLRTHRLGGKLFVLAGIALLVSGLFGGNMVVLVISLVAAGGIPIVYSYFLYRRIEGFKRSST
jgi:uncharacterized membrane protein